MLLPRHVHVSARPSKKLPSPGLHLTLRGLLISLLLLLVAGVAVFGARRSGGGGSGGNSALDLILAVNPSNAPKTEPEIPFSAASVASAPSFDGGRGLKQSQQEATATAAAAAPPDVCALPPRVVGVCRGAVPRWSFDPATGRCEPFTWGGCGEDVANRFDQLRACVDACERGAPAPAATKAGVVSSWPSPSPPSSSSSRDKSINVTTLPSQAVPPPPRRALVDETEQADDGDKDSAAPAGAAAPSAAGGGRLAAALAVVAAAACMVI